MGIHFNSWEKVFWEKGSEAANKYCEQKKAEIDNTLVLFSSLSSVHKFDPASVQTLEDHYRAKKERYLTKGRGEMGRTPFNYPSHNKRFDASDELFSFFDKKINGHQRLADAAMDVLQDVEEEAPEIERKMLCEIKNTHLEAKKKWEERRLIAQDDYHSYLLPTRHNPLKLMNISPLHEQNMKGKGSEVLVLEDGVDFTHDELKHAILNKNNDPNNYAVTVHGTEVCGIIAARNLGVAPETKITVLPNRRFIEIEKSQSRIINFSGLYRNPFLHLGNTPSEFALNLQFAMQVVPDQMGNIFSLMTTFDPELRQTKIEECAHSYVQTYLKYTEGFFTNKLVILANGNEGVSLTDNPSAKIEHFMFLENSRRNNIIRVVNLRPDGLFPHKGATLPGKDFADMTLCAVGTDVLTTFPNNQQGKKTGSSYSAPFVSGVAALIAGEFPYLSPEQIRQCIMETATPIVLNENLRPQLLTKQEEIKNFTKEQIERSQSIYGRGLLNGKAAFDKAREMASSKEEITP